MKTSFIRNITVDCRDTFTLSRFWLGVLGYIDDPDDPASPGDEEIVILDPAGRQPRVLFIEVPEPKSIKNRLHLDLQPNDLRDLTVDEVIAAGATLVDDERRPDGTGWVVLADPEGNEFCIVRSAAERNEPAPRIGPDVNFPDGIRIAGERELIEGMLDWYRAAVIRKVDGLSIRDARTSPLRTGTTLAGVLKHLALVEDSWLHDRFAGLPEPEPWASAPPDDPEWEFTSALEEPLDDLVDLYRTACDRSRRAIAGRALDELSAENTRPFALRFALLHLIEETARHLGQMDVLREYLDGATGE